MFKRDKELVKVWLKDWGCVIDTHYMDCEHLGLKYINYKPLSLDVGRIPNFLLIYKVIDEKLWFLTVLKYALKVV